MIISTWPAIRTGLAVTAVLAVPSAGLAAAVRGGSAVVGALLGLVVVAVFFTVSKVVIATVARYAREFLLPAALGAYVMKIILLGVFMLTLADAVDVPALAWAVFVGVFGWVGAELWVATHTKVPFFEPRRGAGSAKEGEAG
jgi:ATP synthase protein I